MESHKEKRSRPVIKIFMIIATTLIGLIAIGLLILTVSGYNIFEVAKKYGQNVPVLSTLFEEDQTEMMQTMENRLIELEAEVNDREARIEQLQNQVESKDNELNKASQEKTRLENRVDELVLMKEENKRAFSDIIKTYEEMAAKKAAPILSNMNEEEAVRILAEVKPEVLADILAKMEPTKAASFTSLVTASVENTSTTDDDEKAAE
ncbi:hypothetical protein MKX67_10135 [Cytobacillus sp. FSL W7-1323]|uniref:Magnesium transporter MgtE intracellular domain-containing protein n=1 Tax=Cytobacillus kochii TaxID=859143 RepID=A0A248TCR3_9BACI|nr:MULTISPECIES: hypothetical protein [Cytobacillus]ASV65953.1 hypothetical protein CKF48_00595 [Cytobacillus kochii]MEA1851961.1 hypothetical protein [Cytobacillus sp. OWB-43]